MAKTPQRNIRITQDLWQAALAVARERGETVAGVVRQFLREYVATRGANS